VAALSVARLLPGARGGYEYKGKGTEKPAQVSVPTQTRANNLILFLLKLTFMKITDACVYPYPRGDSSVRRMALDAKALGFDRLVAADTPSGEFYGIEIVTGTLIRDTPIRDIINHIKRERNNAAVVSVQAGDNGYKPFSDQR